MSWMFFPLEDEDRLFLSFVECKVSGKWELSSIITKTKNTSSPISREIYQATNDNCVISIIESDGTKRVFQFTENSLANIDQNILTFKPHDVTELVSDDSFRGESVNSRIKL